MGIKVVTTEEMRQIENAADASGVTFAQMMENAGRAVAEAIDVWIGAKDANILVLVGPGNNGGDGLVAARHLADMGATVHLYVWKRETKGDKNWELTRGKNLPVTWLSEDRDLTALRQLVVQSDVIVDALLGTGNVRPIKGELELLLQTVRHTLEERRRPQDAKLCAPAEGSLELSLPMVVAVDVPTGLNSDTGALDPAALPADLTVTMAAVKRGHILSPGVRAIGKLVVADIGIPAVLSDHIRMEMATPAMVAALLPERPADANKGTFGKALIVAGSVNYTGAPQLAARAAVRAGTGLVTLALPQAIHPIVAAHMMEATYLLLPHDMGVLAPDAVRVLAEKVGDYDALLIGPGLTQEKPTAEFLQELLGGGHQAASRRRVGFLHREENETPESSIALPPLVMDADGLNLLAKIDQWWRLLPAPSILTPHPGEMARLIGCETKDVVADRIGCAIEMTARWGHVVLLKGAYTIVADPEGRVVVLPFANPALATAGSGDVLAGTIVAMRAQGLPPFEAAVVGGYLHGLAGELAREMMYEVGVGAGDLPNFLPLAIQRLRELE
ncbi:MAG: bifunctional ADP-dependent NAD(P)H-hydrate dehydratase/NAD(P)H-hydrate epimerase [Ardenticatenia bacterium]|nr:MAG: bifunctional ADP-dependent NAD(P)H-hydrate dehydratase/NAD(P)H-hydrate epimerase [Ardenticatenia bacterium]